MKRLSGAAIGLAAPGFTTAPAFGGRHGEMDVRTGAAAPTAWVDLSLDLVRSAGGFSLPSRREPSPARA